MTITLIGGGIAAFWPWLQTLQRRQKFQGIIKRELEELRPYPTHAVAGNHWWEHLSKRFLHEELLSRERVSENRDFLLSLHPDVLYRVSQLWTAFEKRNSKQWLHFLEELASDRRVGSEGLHTAWREWTNLIKAQND